MEIIEFDLPPEGFVLKKVFTQKDMDHYDQEVDQLFQDFALSILRAKFTPDFDRTVNFRQEQRSFLKVN